MDAGWWVQQKISEAVSGLAKSYDVDSLRSDVGRLEYSLREARAETDGLRNELQACKDQVDQLVSIVDNLARAAAL